MSFCLNDPYNVPTLLGDRTILYSIVDYTLIFYFGHSSVTPSYFRIITWGFLTPRTVVSVDSSLMSLPLKTSLEGDPALFHGSFPHTVVLTPVWGSQETSRIASVSPLVGGWPSVPSPSLLSLQRPNENWSLHSSITFLKCFCLRNIPFNLEQHDVRILKGFMLQNMIPVITLLLIIKILSVNVFY